MTKQLRKGERVSWKSHGGTAHGKVVRKLSSDTAVKEHQVRASDKDPQYLVESDNGGKAAHKPEALRKS